MSFPPFLRKWLGLALDEADRTTALWAVGQPGVGKSWAIASWASDDIRAGRGVGVFDPHQDLFRHVLKRTAILAAGDEALAKRVVIVNPLDPDWAVGINPLQLYGEKTPERIAAFFTGVALKIWGFTATEAPRMTRLMTHTFMALAELGLTLVELPLFLSDGRWRQRVVERVNNPAVKGYFLNEFPANERLRQEWTQSTLNKIGQLVLDPDLRLILGQRKNTVDFRDLMDRRRILLVNLPKGVMGTENSQLLGAFLLGMIQQAALSRADLPSGARSTFYLYLDEFQNYTTDHIQEILSESRKYGLSLILAHQYLGQLPQDLKAAVKNAFGTLACFRVGYQDAAELAREVFSPNLEPSGGGGWRLQWWGRVPLVLPQGGQSSLPADWERHVQELTGLKTREFWVRQKGGSAALKQRSRELAPPICSAGTLGALVTLSGHHYARRKEAVRRELTRARPRLLAELAGDQPPANLAEGNQGIPPLWGE